ncbi:DUF1648 domain-containing protein [Protaetiibacter sp. SSC-01]|uniref:DUF1648 domain-containing protein n=1 Tax=Protaetiibacter sp. SSC-01 TaxID=2759943 RepID=UPI001656E231|nr:DUF1648 domain-containing protein [Protaetiibacter sp. SSC-01]QNO36738.1 DUF1648 domain-containing protein [Protaetiibacter sp. SSC-01]
MTAAASARPTRERRPLSLWIVTVALPLIVWGAAVAVQLAWLPSLPDPVAIHWGSGTGPDGFAPAWVSVALTAGLGVGLTGMFAAFVGIGPGPVPTSTHKLLAVMSLGVSLFVGSIVTASLGIQLGLDDARDAADIDGWMPLAFALGAVAAGIAWFALPKAVHAEDAATPARPLELAPGERSAWIATVRMPTSVVAIVVSAIGLTIVMMSFVVAVTDGAAWPLFLVPVLLLVLCGLGLVWRVRVDATGLTVRSLPFGWPRRRIRAADIASVSVAHVDPTSQFGGWGWRWAPGGGTGVITRAGEGILVVTRDDRRFTVSVDDAATAAALLAAYSA